MRNSKKVSKDLHSTPAFRKVKSPTPNKEYNDHESYHDLNDFQQEIHSLHLDAQECYTKICKNIDPEEKLPENFMDPDWFQREAQNRKKRKAQTSSTQNSDILSLHKSSTSSMTSDIDSTKISKPSSSTLSFEFPNTKQSHLKTSNHTDQIKKVRKHNSISFSKYNSHDLNLTYCTFIKWNALIFITVFLQMLFFLTFYLFYLQKQLFPQSPISFEAPNIMTHILFTSVLFAYQIASLHCGYVLIKNLLTKTKKVTIILCSPILFIIASILGLLCEIPYFIFSCFKLKKLNKNHYY